MQRRPHAFVRVDFFRAGLLDRPALVAGRGGWKTRTPAGKNPFRPQRPATSAMLEINPFLWRVARSARKRLIVWLALLASALLYFLCSRGSPSGIWG